MGASVGGRDCNFYDAKLTKKLERNIETGHFIVKTDFFNIKSSVSLSFFIETGVFNDEEEPL